MKKATWINPEVEVLSVKNTESGPTFFSVEDPNLNFYGPTGEPQPLAS
jgi:hypothetical protein